jgi:hypothetical protein
MENIDLGTVILVILVLVAGFVLGNVFRTAATKRGYSVGAAAATTKTRTARPAAPKKRTDPATKRPPAKRKTATKRKPAAKRMEDFPKR